jgi:hypothetical protein
MRVTPNSSGGGDHDMLTHLLRAAYRAPSEPGYWERLDARILGRTIGSPDAWWTPFTGWIGAGLIAAGLTAVILTSAVMRDRSDEARAAYEMVAEAPAALAAQTAAAYGPRSPREATLRYVISH